MPYPSKFISDSDLSSTPSSLEGGKRITLTTPSSVTCQALKTVAYSSSATFAKDFDTVEFIITCDQFPDINVYNGYVEVVGADGITIFTSIEISGRTVRLVATYTAFWDATYSGSLTFRAVVVPIKSPFSQ